MKGNDLALIVLLGGNSTRMGKAKAFLLFNSRETFLEHILHSYLALPVKKIVLVVSPAIKNEVQRMVSPLKSIAKIMLVENQYPELGRFKSILLGAEALEDESAFIQNIDNPFVETSLLKEMVARLADGLYVVPVFKGAKGHPVLVSSEILDKIRNTNAGPDTNLREVLNDFTARELVAEDDRIHANINSESDYRHYFKHAAIY